ncbi:MAG: OB-fold protein [Bacteroidota bacterium]
MKNKFVKIGLAVVIVGLIGAFAVYHFVYNKPHKDYAKEEAAYALKAEALFNEFVDNSQKANEKYTGKVVQISGTPDKVENTDSTLVLVFAFAEGMFGDEGIRCHMSPEYQNPDDLNLSGNMTLKGFCTGYNDTDVILEHCSVP